MVKKVSVILLGFILFSCILIPSQMYAKRLGDTILKKSEKTIKKSQETTTKTDNENVGRKLGEHTFPTTMLFNSPIPSSRFGFAQGFNFYKIKKSTTTEYMGGSLIEVFNMGCKLNNKFSLDLNANAQLSGGFDSKITITKTGKKKKKVSLPSVNVNLNLINLKGGPVYKLFESDKGMLVTLSGRIMYSKGIKQSLTTGFDAMIDKINKLDSLSAETKQFLLDLIKKIYQKQDSLNLNFKLAKSIEEEDNVDPNDTDSTDEEDADNTELEDELELLDGFEGMTDLLSEIKDLIPSKDDFKAIRDSLLQNLKTNTTLTGFAPTVGVAYPINKWLGVQSSIEFEQYRIEQYRIYKSTSTKIKKKVVVKRDTFNQFNFNNALSLDFRHIINFPICLAIEHLGKDSFSSNKLGLGLYYQGRGEIQLGLFGATRVDSKDKKFMYGQFNITYFFSSLGSEKKEEKIISKEIQLTKEEKEMMSQHFNKGTEFMKRGKYEWAIQEFQEVLKYDSNHKPSLEKIRRCEILLKTTPAESTEDIQYKTKEPEVIKIKRKQ